MIHRHKIFLVLKINSLIILLLLSTVIPTVNGASQQQTMQQSTQISFEKAIQNTIAIEGEPQPLPSIIIGPYTLRAELTRAIICWQTNSQTNNNKVYWGISPNYDQVTYESVILLLDIPNIHVVHIDGLAPSTTYTYRVYSDGTFSSIQTFTTARTEDQTVHFVAVGDTQQGNDLLYTYDTWYENVTRIADGIATCDPDFVLHTGDIAFWTNDPTHWNEFFNVSTYLTKSVFYPVRGNHDEQIFNPLFPYVSLFQNYFTNPSGYDVWYSFDSGPVHFIGLNANLGPLNPLWYVQYAWLVNDLQNNQKPWTIVSLHKPLFSSGQHGCNGFLISQLHLLFTEYQIDLVLSGHDHGFQHNEVDGITYIVTGGGGGSLYDVDQSWFTQYCAKTHHFCSITVDPTSLTLEAINENGEMFYSFSLYVQDDSLSEEPAQQERIYSFQTQGTLEFFNN